MRMKNKIKKRLAKINRFLKSGKKPGLTVIHQLRLEIKHLEAFLELLNTQNNMGAGSVIPNRLDALFHEAGKLRKIGLERKAIESIISKNSFSKPVLYLKQLEHSGKRIARKLIRKRSTSPAFKPHEFSGNAEVKITSQICKQFLSGQTSLILDLLNRDILSDIKSLHQLRKILKSILFVLPLCKKVVEPVVVFLKTHKKFIKSIESEIGSLHDTDSFITGLGRKHRRIDVYEEPVLRKIKKEWLNGMKRMKKDLETVLPALRQFALGLKDQTVENLRVILPLYN
jgi:CHAD domain-containing protein